MYPVNLMEANMKSAILKFWRDEEGATAIEYGLIAALIAVAAIAGMTSIGEGLQGIFKTVAGKLGVGTEAVAGDSED